MEERAIKSKGLPTTFNLDLGQLIGKKLPCFHYSKAELTTMNDSSPQLLQNKEAFDEVLLDGLFQIIQFWINETLWQLSRTIHVKQGVNRGRVLSAWLFRLYINDLLYSSVDSGRGKCLPWGNTTAILLYNDTALLAAHLTDYFFAHCYTHIRW